MRMRAHKWLFDFSKALSTFNAEPKKNQWFKNIEWNGESTEDTKRSIYIQSPPNNRIHPQTEFTHLLRMRCGLGPGCLPRRRMPRKYAYTFSARHWTLYGEETRVLVSQPHSSNPDPPTQRNHIHMLHTYGRHKRTSASACARQKENHNNPGALLSTHRVHVRNKSWDNPGRRATAVCEILYGETAQQRKQTSTVECMGRVWGGNIYIYILKHRRTNAPHAQRGQPSCCCRHQISGTTKSVSVFVHNAFVHASTGAIAQAGNRVTVIVHYV